jgi:hypothetical protein
MALNVAAGTETLQALSFGDADATQDLIVGVVHHIYTVLSTIVFSVSIGAAGDTYLLVITGHDNHAGADSNASIMVIAKVVAVAGQTFVFNDKFSMNGFGSAAYTEPLNTAAEMATVAQQGGTLNRYQYIPLDADVDCDIHVTFIDQNNA